MTVDLDTRMRQASAALSEASSGLAPTAPPADRRRLVLVAAAVVVVALAATAVVLLRDDDRQADVTTDLDAVPRLVPGNMPEDLPPTGAADLPLAATEAIAAAMPISVYGDPAAADPFADVDLGLLVYPADDRPIDEPTETVRGRPAEVRADSVLGTTVSWEEEPGLVITACSFELDRDQLLTVVEGLVVENGVPAPGTLPPELAGRLELVASTEMLTAMSPPVPASSVGHVAGYQDPDDGRGVIVATVGADDSDFAVMRWMATATTTTTVRGHQGWASSRQVGATSSSAGAAGSGDSSDSDSGDSGEGEVSTNDETGSAIHTLMWEESPGVVVAVQGFDVPADQVRAVAESLRPASDQEWEELLRLVGGEDGAGSGGAENGEASDAGDGMATETETNSPAEPGTVGGHVSAGGSGVVSGSASSGGGGSGGDTGPYIPDDAVVTLQGEYANGTWAVYIDADGNLCGSTDTATSGSESCRSQWERATLLTEGDQDDAPVVVYGVRPEGATGHTISGVEVTGPSQSTEAPDGRTIYAVVVYGGPVPDEVGFIGQDGQVFETAPVT